MRVLLDTHIALWAGVGSKRLARAEHAVAVERLAAIHGDLFDRTLVAQTLEEPLTLITTDALVASYSAAIMKVA